MASNSTAVVSLPTLTQTGATVALRAASQHATDNDIPLSIAIVDAHTHLLAFTRHDTAKHSSIDTALSMATTSASNRLPTSALADTNPLSTGLALSNRLCTIPGGLPILAPNGDLLGAIGCSTGTSLQAEDAAAAGRDAVVALIQREAEDEKRRIEDERAEVLRLWKEKEDEVENLRDALECERYGGKRRKTSSVELAGSARVPDTPPEEGEVGEYVKASFVGEVRVGSY